MLDILFACISDIHLKENNKDRIERKLTNALESIKAHTLATGNKKCVILFPGDLGYSGNTKEYDYLEQILKKYSSDFTYIFSPGNHDHNFSNYSGNIREQLLKTELSSIDDSILNIVSSGQNEYLAFEERNSSLNYIVPNSTFLSKEFHIGDAENFISITSMNTAWCSSLKERGGELRFPLNQMNRPGSNALVKIAFFHHPLSWLEPNNQKEIRNYLRKNFDIVITGHEHLHDSFQIVNQNNTLFVLESMPLDDHTVTHNGFFTFQISEEDITLEKFIFNGSKLDYPSTAELFYYKKNHDDQLGLLNPDFHKSLFEHGTGFTHPEKDELTLDDIFIYPNLRDLSPDSRVSERISSSRLLENNLGNKIMLIGEEYIGKTTLLKKLYLDLIKRNERPIYISASETNKLKKFDARRLNKIVQEQYSNFDVHSLIQNHKNRFIFIDDFDQLPGDDKSKENFITYIESIFQNVIISVSDSFDLGHADFLGTRVSDNTYSRYEILRFGHRLRYELILRWNGLKEPSITNDKNKEIARIDQHHRTIGRVSGKNYIPSTPLFLLTVLQSMDSDNHMDINTSSYGYYYQYLITTSLGSASVKKESLDEIFNYIKELSIFLYNNSRKQEHIDSLWTFNNNFCAEYDLKIDFNSRMALLEKARIIDISDGYVKFKYPYIYYFFIAKHFAEKINKEDTKTIIDEMIKNLHHKKNMNILMFLTHHSRDETILDRICKRASRIFKSYNPADLAAGARCIDEMIDQVPSFKVKSGKDVIEYRRNNEDQKDHYDDTCVNDSDDESYEDESKHDSENLDFITEFNLSFKSLELLGQLARNYYGSLKVNQKEALLTEAIKTPLRALGFMFENIDGKTDLLLKNIKQKLLESRKDLSSLSQQDLDKFTRKLVFELYFMMSYQITRKISQSIGSQELNSLINKISSDINTPASKLINLSCTLDLGNKSSFEDLELITKSIKEFPLSTSVMRSLIVNYLYMFEVSEPDMQKVCAITGVDFEPVSLQLGLEKISSSR
ncbi:metallophosphoesterase [Aeromonas veronii]|uniref:STAND family AAA ATPase n=1 Tax=Aeromonas veronii TaxID=654 RepID=UPI001116DC82|nr:metallophosphoesterase [Aeromonas veronii]TNI50310.1 serine/threonine protein phosphatase [Aeromonas veronii]